MNNKQEYFILFCEIQQNIFCVLAYIDNHEGMVAIDVTKKTALKVHNSDVYCI